MTMNVSTEELRRAFIRKANYENANTKKLASDECKREILSRLYCNQVLAELKTMTELGKKIDTFDYSEVIRSTVDEAMQKLAFGYSRKHIYWAPTQSGKSAFKAVKMLTYLVMNIPVVVITKGKGECLELKRKFSESLKGYKNRILCLYKNGGNELSDSEKAKIKKQFQNSKDARVLVIPDTHQKIKHAHKLLRDTMKRAKRNRRRYTGCALILDEVDAVINRSEDGGEENERALERLTKELAPSMVMVTATPIPVLMKYLDDKPIVTWSYEHIPDYNGLENMVHVDDLDEESLNDGFEGIGSFTINYHCVTKNSCKGVFSEDKIQDRSKFPDIWKKKNPCIPRSNSQYIKLLRTSLKDGEGKIVLVDTCAWVDTEKNGTIFHQASGTQDYFFNKNIQFIVIVVHSTNVYYRLPGHKYGFQCKKSLSELIDEIDTKYGVKMPVVVFGYHAMKRSRSFRSDRRVPSCMIMCLGKGQSNESVRQAAGRLTSKGRKLLENNCKTKKVQMLCPKEDFEMIQKHDRLVLEILKLYKEKGWGWKKINSYLSESSENYYLTDSRRRTGNFIPGKAKKRKREKAKSTPVAKSSSSINRVMPLNEDNNESYTSTGNDEPLAAEGHLLTDEGSKESPTIDIYNSSDDINREANANIDQSTPPIRNQRAEPSPSLMMSIERVKKRFKKLSVNRNEPLAKHDLREKENETPDIGSHAQEESTSCCSSGTHSSDMDIDSIPFQDALEIPVSYGQTKVSARGEVTTAENHSDPVLVSECEDVVPIKSEQQANKKRKCDEITIHNDENDLSKGDEKSAPIDLTIDDDDDDVDNN